ncbi:hypothetical protein [Haloprofundus marisrubri]|uniref:hypothetical protein n=1 Tax=Haloprofundus marisrubri TaxID=1514971 RepID=UPI0012BB06BD|nr:hypothetical protein [Haloprofundus marisrubri]
MNRQASKNLRVAVERTRAFVNEGPHESSLSRFDHHLRIRVNRLTAFVLVTPGDEYGNTLLES